MPPDCNREFRALAVGMGIASATTVLSGSDHQSRCPVQSSVKSAEALGLARVQTAIQTSARFLYSDPLQIARVLLAVGTMLTLATDPIQDLLDPRAMGTFQLTHSRGLSRYTLFALLPSDWWHAARIVAIAGLLTTLVGWRPRIAGVLQWYITWSVAAGFEVLEGGDQLAANITLLLLPICLIDGRRRAWRTAFIARSGADLFIARASRLAVMLQVSVVYLHAAVAKASKDDWTSGTAAYYWITHEAFGAPHWLMPLIRPLLQTSLGVVAVTYGVIVLEFALAAGLLASTKTRRVLLHLGVSFHVAIAVIHGLVAFSLVMTGALILYLKLWGTGAAGIKQAPSSSDSGPDAAHAEEQLRMVR